MIVGLGLGAAVVWGISRRLQSNTNQGQLQELQDRVTDRLDRVTEQLDKRLQENVRATHESKSFLAERVSSAERSVRAVTNSLTKLENVTVALKGTADEISTFQKLLKNPKIRGSFGEVLLTNLLSEVLPNDRYEVQFRMPESGEIADAIIKLQDGYIVAVDAKFPLANYEAYVLASEPDEKKRAQAALLRDVKKHVSDISKKYIAPHSQTLDYAFMYVPAEGVYYEIVVRDDALWDFCLQHHVVPVSPNSFLAYLQTILVGLRGLKVEEQAREILSSLRQVRHDFKQFAEDFGTVGKHLTNAKNRFDDSARRLDKFANRLEQIEGSSSAPLPEKTQIESALPANTTI